MSNNKFEPKSGNPRKRTEELKAHRDRLAEQNSKNQRERSVRRKNAAASGVIIPATSWPKDDDMPVIESNWTPRTSLDDVAEVREAGLSTVGSTVTPESVARKRRERTRKMGVGFIAVMGLSAMVFTGLQIPFTNGSSAPEPEESQVSVSTDENGNTILVDSNGVPLDVEFVGEEGTAEVEPSPDPSSPDESASLSGD